MTDVFEFDDPDLGKKLDTLSDAELNSLSYGTVRLKPDGEVVFYSERERQLSGYNRNAVGLNWLKHIAPCMQTALFETYLEEAIKHAQLDAIMEMTGDFSDPTRIIELRLMSSSTADFIWFILRRI